ncbi:MAG TPA: 2-C-methyl-D-erythritol 2,4-cyclodiphosphate synthase [archaeon]|nr:2-C-methyl-D-erythritol 2,4-cyclodiphosphate synthase [archaeon]
MSGNASGNKISAGDSLLSCAAVIAAGGEGQRMGGKVKKQFLEIGGKSILRHCLELFLSLPEIEQIVVVLPADEVERFRSGLAQAEAGRVIVAVGGATRQESVYNGLAALDPERIKVVAIHDAVRPLVELEVVRETLKLASQGTGAVACAPMRDTVKRSQGEIIKGTVHRGDLWLAQTPQSFPLKMIKEAHRAAREESYTGTDDSALCERLGFPVRIVSSSPQNVKITEPTDMDYVQCRLNREQAPKGGDRASLRIGEGYDVHPLVEGRRLVLGGVVIPHEKGLAGHSDADVLLHAVADALLGAAALGDIGRHFPDTDPAFKDADSAALLEQVVRLVEREGFHPVNLDATVIAQSPRLAPYIEKIRGRLAEILGLELGEVSVKAKTHEGLGTLGRGEGLAARAVVLVSR